MSASVSAPISSSSESSHSLSSVKSLSDLYDIDVHNYDDWTKSPLGEIVKDRLKGKVAIVTGASTGIGAVSARRLAAEGASVLLMARRAEKLSSLVSSIRSSGGIADFFVGDVSQEKDNERAVAAAVEKFGNLHIAFNNAGISPGWGKAPWELSDDTYKDLMGTNVNAIFYGLKYQAAAIARSGGGVIINNASLAAGVSFGAGGATYAASKAWVVAFTFHAAWDAAKIGVRLNCISPGPTISDFVKNVSGVETMKQEDCIGMLKQSSQGKIASGRPTKPEEIAAAVAFLASKDAEAITGVDLKV